MHFNWSPPYRNKITKGGSTALSASNASLASTATGSTSLSTLPTPTTPTTPTATQPQLNHTSAPLKLGNNKSSICRNHSGDTNRSTLSLYSNTSTNTLLTGAEKPHYHHHHQHSHSHSHSHGHHGGGRGSSAGAGRTMGTTTHKRGKKPNWGSRERAGMSFLIVIAFFAVFGLIILTELFMIDERSHGGTMVLRHGNNYGSRLGDSMPDYDNVKDDYDLLDENLLSDSKLGFVQFRDNKLKIQDSAGGAGDMAGRLAGILLNSVGGPSAAPAAAVVGAGGAGGGGAGGGGIGNGAPLIPWGKVLPAKVEQTLPHYPLGVQPNDGAWQVVNGTRFKFFVFSAYYDRRDGVKLVRVIGATKTRSPERVWCRFWYAPQRRNGSTMDAEHYTSATLMARVKVIRENWNLKYSACFVLCPVRAPELQVPQYVSVVARLRAPPGNLLQLRNTDWDEDFMHRGNGGNATATMPHGAAVPAFNATGQHGNGNATTAAAALAAVTKSLPSLPSGLPSSQQIPDKIAVCVKPFHFNYDQAVYLMEFLEFYALMGVAHFTFYNHTLGPHATCVLQHYISGDVPSRSTAWDVDLAELGGKGPTLMGMDLAKVDAVLSGTYNSNKDANHNNDATAAATPAPAALNAAADNVAEAEATLPPLQRYQSSSYAKPTINILPWNLRMRSQKEIRTEGLFAALNDCLYRTMYRYRYLALVDLDEFIVPRHNDTLNELINSLNHRFRNRNMGAYSFQNAFFYLQFPDDPLVTLTHPDVPATLHSQPPYAHSNTRLRATLVTQRKTRRRLKLHPQKQRSKYICRPEAVVEAGNHFVWEFAPQRGSLNVPPTDAILQHYRVCEFGGNDCIKAPSVVDRTATKYVNRLVERVELVYKHLKQRCDLPELPVLPSEQRQPQPPQQPLKNPQQQQQPQIQEQLQLQPPRTDQEKSVVPKPKPISSSDDERIKTIANVKSKRDNDHDNNATTMTKSLTIDATLKAHAGPNGAADPGATIHSKQSSHVRKKRKVIVFDQDEHGVPHARIEFVYK